MNEVWRARSGIVSRGCARGRGRSRRPGSISPAYGAGTHWPCPRRCRVVLLSPGILSPRKITIKGARYAHVAHAMAQAQTLAS